MFIRYPKILDFGVRFDEYSKDYNEFGVEFLDAGHSYWSFNGECLGGSAAHHRYAVLRHHSKELAHLKGVYNVEEETLVVPYEYEDIEILKREIDYHGEDYNIIEVQTNYFICKGVDGKKKMLYKGLLVCEDIIGFTPIKGLSSDYYNSNFDGKFIIIRKDDEILLYYKNSCVRSLECDNLYMLHREEGNCWFMMHDPETKRYGLLNQKGLYIPLGNNEVAGAKYSSNSLIGIKEGQLYDTDTNAPFIENKQLCFVGIASLGYRCVIIAYEDIINSCFVFYNGEKEIITGVHEEVEGKGECITFDEKYYITYDEKCYFCCEDKKFYQKPWEQDEDEYDNDETYYDSYHNRTYEKYRGTYAQDEAGYSDQDIDDAFDGDPGAYWNID